MSVKKFFLLNSPELPTPGTHYFTSSKFMSGFKYYGYETREANQLNDIEDGSIVLISNHGIKHPEISSENGWNALNILALNYPNCIFICWFFHSFYEKIPFKKFILTGEHFHQKPTTQEHIECWELQKKINNYVPLTFASNLLPDTVGKYIRNETINGCFMGTAYKYHWVNELPNIIYRAGLNHGQQLNEEDRIQCFLHSKIAFGFHHDTNVLNNVVVERVFEGMAYGCVVISDNPIAGVITDGIVQIATTKEEFMKIYFELLFNEEKRKELQLRGYEWIKKEGLYIHIVKNFIDKINML
jgi:spore maturation protein CgeB